MTNEIPYDFVSSYKEWSRIPVDDFGYLFPQEILFLHQLQRKELVDIAQQLRWSPFQWRNMGNSLRDFMGLDKVQGKLVMDFGCGLGLDSLEYSKSGADVVLADIHPWGLFTAQQVFCQITGLVPNQLCIVFPQRPYLSHVKQQVDLFWSMGVLHHFPWGMDLLRMALTEWIKPDGEARICLYSDKRWRDLTGTELPTGKTWEHPKFGDYVRACDSVGMWSDWYNEEKLKRLTADFATVVECRPLCDGQFLGAVLKGKVNA